MVLTAIGYVWFRVATDGAATSDGTAGSVLDSGEAVRRVDLGTNTFVAQQAHTDLTERDIACRLVSLEQGAFGIGMGEHWYLIYNAEDEAQVLSVVDELLGDTDLDSDSGLGGDAEPPSHPDLPDHSSE